MCIVDTVTSLPRSLSLLVPPHASCSEHGLLVALSCLILGRTMLNYMEFVPLGRCHLRISPQPVCVSGAERWGKEASTPLPQGAVVRFITQSSSWDQAKMRHQSSRQPCSTLSPALPFFQEPSPSRSHIPQSLPQALLLESLPRGCAKSI